MGRARNPPVAPLAADLRLGGCRRAGAGADRGGRRLRLLLLLVSPRAACVCLAVSRGPPLDPRAQHGQRLSPCDRAVVPGGLPVAAGQPGRCRHRADGARDADPAAPPGVIHPFLRADRLWAAAGVPVRQSLPPYSSFGRGAAFRSQLRRIHDLVGSPVRHRVVPGQGRVARDRARRSRSAAQHPPLARPAAALAPDPDLPAAPPAFKV